MDDTGIMTAEYKLRSAVARCVEVLLPARTEPCAPLKHADYNRIAAAVSLRQAAGCELKELAAAVNAVRVLMGTPEESETRAVWAMVLSAYDAVLAARERTEAGAPRADESAGPFVIGHVNKPGKVMLARFNPNAGDGLAHMTWVDEKYSDGRSFEFCKAMLAAYVTLSGDDGGLVIVGKRT